MIPFQMDIFREGFPEYTNGSFKGMVHPDDFKRIDLEITESALNRDVNYIKAECDKMRGLGYHI